MNRELFYRPKLLFTLSTLIVLYCIGNVNLDILGFDGFPLDNPLQALLSVVVVLVAIEARNRVFFNIRLLQVVIVLSILLIGINYYINNKSNFLACYKTEYTSIANFENSFISPEPCQFSYKNPFNPNLTREEKYINFYSTSDELGVGIEFTNWNLHFFNQTGFNYYDKKFYNLENDDQIEHWWGKNLNDERVGPLSLNEFKRKKELNELNDYFGLGIVYIENEPSRSWLPFSVTFRSQKPTTINQEVSFQYVGELTIYINEEIYILDKEYRTNRSETLFIPKDSNITIDYSYRYSPVIGNHPGAPYANLQMLVDEEPVNLFIKSLTNHDNVIVTALFLINLLIYFSMFLHRKDTSYYLFGLVVFIVNSTFVPLRIQGVIYFLISLLAILKYRKTIINSFPIILFFSFLTTIATTSFNTFNYVKYTYGGGDALKYESWAQEIIIQRSLRGGEDIFFYMPGYRYLISFLRIFTGDSHNVVVILYTFTIILILYLIFSNFDHFQKNIPLNMIFVLSIYIVMFTFSVKSNVYESFSEWPTWLLFLLFIYFIKNENHFVIYIPFLLILFRQNQLIGAIFMLILIIKNTNIKFTFFSSAISSFIFLFPFFHNDYFGGKFTFYKDPFESGAYYITPAELLKHIFFLQKSESVKFHTDFLFANQFNDFVSELGGPVLLTLLNIYLFLFITVFFAKATTKQLNWNTILEYLMVSGFLLVHLIYQVHTYYPRHIIIGYLALIYVTIKSLSDFHFEKSNALSSKKESIDDSKIT